LLPTPIAIYLMLGLAFMASDFFAIHAFWGLIQVAIYETALGINIVLRLRFRARLKQNEDRLIAGECLNCGYDMRATPEQCPECGQQAVR